MTEKLFNKTITKQKDKKMYHEEQRIDAKKYKKIINLL